MLLEAALALEIHRTNPAVSETTAKQYAHWVVAEAAPQGIDPWVFHGIAFHESRWTAGAVKHEGNGTCSVGLGQINVKDCNSNRISVLKDPRLNIRAMAILLGKLKKNCQTNCGELGWIRGYNAGDTTYVPTIRQKVDQAHAHYRESALREVPARVHLRRGQRSQVQRQVAP
jgi:hypothetical protein